MTNKNFSTDNINFGIGEVVSDLGNKDRVKYKDVKLGKAKLIPMGSLDFNSIDHDAYYLVIRVYNKGFYLFGPYASKMIASLAKKKIALLEIFKFKHAHVQMSVGRNMLKRFPGMFQKTAFVSAQ